MEDQDYTIVRINGTYSQSNHFSLKTLQNEYYLQFDLWRTNVKPGLWMPKEPPMRPRDGASKNWRGWTARGTCAIIIL
jgi:hypothetical protein